MTVDSVLVADHYTKSSKFRNILQPLEKDGVRRSSDDSEKWFSLQFSIRPLDDVADYKLSLRVNPVTFVLCPPLLDRLYDFFRPEKQIFVVSDLRYTRTHTRVHTYTQTHTHHRKFPQSSFSLSLHLPYSSPSLSPTFPPSIPSLLSLLPRSAAYSQLGALGKQTAAQLALALEDEAAVDVCVCVVSPNIVIPESFEQVCVCECKCV